jgi:hypothetical protein
VVEALKKGRVDDLLHVLGLVRTACKVDSDEKLRAAIDGIIGQVAHGNIDPLLRLVSCVPNVGTASGMVNMLKKAFQPDPHLAIHTALRHPFLYTGHIPAIQSHPPSSLHHLITDHAALSLPSSRLHRLLPDAQKSAYYTGLRTLQLCGQVGQGRKSREHVERLNVGESGELNDHVASVVYIE